MKIQEAFRCAGIKSRIAPTPSSIHKNYGCGMCILVDEENICNAKSFLNSSSLNYSDIVKLEYNIKPNRDKYC